MFLWAYQDFDLASLMGVSSWTVWLFDAQVGGLPLAETLWKTRGPLLLELITLGLILRLPPGGTLRHRYDRTRRREARQHTPPSVSLPGRRSPHRCIRPDSPRRAAKPRGCLRRLAKYPPACSISREIGLGLLNSSSPPSSSTFSARKSCTGWTRTPLQMLGLSVLAVGLLGPLPLALLMVTLFQRTWLQIFYNTGLPGSADWFSFSSPTPSPSAFSSGTSSPAHPNFSPDSSPVLPMWFSIAPANASSGGSTPQLSGRSPRSVTSAT
ncbi:MAG: hypothetical protein U0903_10710 [Planctomycetales bacterium]